MASVILNWIYIIITTFIVGYGVLRFLTRHFAYQVKNMDASVVCGLVCVTVYAQFFSLLAGVGLLANILLLALCLFILWRERAGFADMFSRYRAKWRGKDEKWMYVRWAMILGLFLFFAYGTSRGMIHYDTGLYHAQSIRWIEEYGVVKGLGNLHGRLAYNSSSFALSALYSMAFLGGASLHCCAGFLAFLLSVVCLEIGNSLRVGRLCASVFARVMCVYYLVNIFDEMISPASDYFMVLLAFYIVIRWLDLLESGERTILPYGLLCVLSVFLMTVKLSAAFILLLTIYPAVCLLREKKWKEICAYLGLGIVTAIPFFVRNVLISGWLVYPFTQIDLFSLTWKIPKGLADYDAKEIQVYGRGYTDVLQFYLPVREWMPGWFHTLAGSDKLLTLAAATSVFVLLIYAAGMIFGLWKRRWELLLVQGTVAASFVFWLCTSPLIRYGCVWVYLTPAVVFGGIYDAVLHIDSVRSESAERGNSVLVILFLLYKCFALGKEAVSYEGGYWIAQKDYENYETYDYEIDGVIFYCPVEGDRVGYEAFPSSPQEAQIMFLGDGLADGFVVK
ncbi:MAG: hypothetical protein K2N43_06205 [Lachnospiraceae bacterium]|nr:hypothetical protein [Lachnospiraceae bacterium]